MPLVLTRRKGERVQIGLDIIVEVVTIRGSSEVKLMFLVPADVAIVRLAPGEGLVRIENECETCGFIECECSKNTEAP